MLTFNNEMCRFLEFASRGSVIAQILMNGDSKHILIEGNFISKVEKEIDMVSFLPVSKFEKVEDVWQKGRTPIKIGKFLRRFLNEYSIKNYEIDDVMIEKFVNTFKSYFSRDNSKLKIVEGSDILKYYQEDSYHVNGGRYGTLWNSCMRQSERNKFMKLYVDNIDKVKMLVFFDDNEKIRARALLWDGVRDHNDKDARYTFGFFESIATLPTQTAKDVAAQLVDYRKIVITRDPFERILSAYYNKIVSPYQNFTKSKFVCYYNAVSNMQKKFLDFNGLKIFERDLDLTSKVSVDLTFCEFIYFNGNLITSFYY